MAQQGARQPAVTGTVTRVGVPPADMLAIRPESGDPVRVEGSLVPEIQSLTGAVVAIYGTVTDGSPWKTVAAEAYDVVSVDGRRPYVGTLRVTDRGIWLDGERTWELEGAGEALRSRNGAKVYIVGVMPGNKLIVQSYGIIRNSGN